MFPLPSGFVREASAGIPEPRTLWRNSIEIAVSGQAAEVLLLIQEAIA